MSLARIELLCADAPVTVYPPTDTCPGGRHGKKNIEFTRPTARSIEVARRRWQQMQHDRLHHIDRGFTSPPTPAPAT